MAIKLGLAARELRQKLNLSLREAALELGISYVHLCNIENEKNSPSPEMVEKFHEAWGIDLYMYAVAFHGTGRETPKGLSSATKALGEAWKRHIEKILRDRFREGKTTCLISAD